MHTYLFLNVHKWKRRPFLFLVILLLPLLAFMALYPFFKTSVEDVAVPVAVVDEDKSQWSQLIQERVAADGRVRLVKMDRHKAREAVRKGEVEAAFILQEGLMESLRRGTITDSVLWLRTERSQLDVFVKEQLGAEMMRLSLNAKAANTLQNWGEDVSWDEAFQHSDEYWEPEPLFQMAYSSKRPEEQETTERTMEQWKLVTISIFFLYAWVWFVSLLHGLVQDEKAGRLARIVFLRGSLKSYYVMHYFILSFTALVAFFTALNGMLYVTNASEDLFCSWNVWSGIVFLVTSLFTFIIFLVGKRKPGILMVVGMFALLSFTFHVLPFEGLGIFEYLLPHSWLVELNPLEAGGVSFDHIEWSF